MAEKGNALSRNPNVCASCSSLADGMEESNLPDCSDPAPEQSLRADAAEPVPPSALEAKPSEPTTRHAAAA